MRILASSSLLLLLALVAAPARAAEKGAYTLVRLDGSKVEATGLALTSHGFKGSTAASLFEIDAAQVDYYRTFLENVQSGASNVVVFKTGALLRFDRLSAQDGTLHVSVAGGGQLDLAEGLVDYRASVEQGAMVNLPAGAGASISISPSQGPGGVGGEPGGDAPEELAPAGSVKRRGSLVNRRRAGAADRLPSSDEPPQEIEPPPESQDPLVPEDAAMNEPPVITPENNETQGDPQSPISATHGRPFGRPGGSNSGNDGGGSDQNGEASGQAIMSIVTDYQGPIAGILLKMTYPSNLTLTDPNPEFKGFAQGWMPQPNGMQPGQFQIAGVSAVDVSAAPGEILRLPFTWTGSQPDGGMFKVSGEAHNAAGEHIRGFNVTSDVQIN